MSWLNIWSYFLLYLAQKMIATHFLAKVSCEHSVLGGFSWKLYVTVCLAVCLSMSNLYSYLWLVWLGGRVQNILQIMPRTSFLYVACYIFIAYQLIFLRCVYWQTNRCISNICCCSGVLSVFFSDDWWYTCTALFLCYFIVIVTMCQVYTCTKYYYAYHIVGVVDVLLGIEYIHISFELVL